MFRFVKLVARNSARNKRRTLLTVMSIAVSIFIFAALMSLPTLVNQVLRDRASSQRLIVHSTASYFSNPLPYAYLTQIQAVKHVEIATGYSIFMSTYRDPGDLVPVVAVDPEHINELFSDYGITRSAAREFARIRTAALVGRTLQARFGWKVGEHVILRGVSYPVDLSLSILGTLSGAFNSSFLVMCRRDHLDEVLGNSGTVNMFWVKVDSSASIPGVIHEIDQTFANSAFETNSESEEVVIQNRLASQRLYLDGAKILAAVVVVTIGLVAANTAAMSVRERRRELAVMRSLGFTRAAVVAMVTAEGFAIGVAGGVIGCLAAYLGLRLVPYASRSLGVLAYVLSIPGANIVAGLGVAAAIGTLAGLIPALAASRHDIVDQLRAI
jgi:putative ABC transport system permease protein